MSEEETAIAEQKILKEIAGTLAKICTVLESMDKRLVVLENIREGINIGFTRMGRK